LISLIQSKSINKQVETKASNLSFLNLSTNPHFEQIVVVKEENEPFSKNSKVAFLSAPHN